MQTQANQTEMTELELLKKQNEYVRADIASLKAQFEYLSEISKDKNSKIKVLYDEIQELVLSDIQIVTTKISEIDSHINKCQEAINILWMEDAKRIHKDGYEGAYQAYKKYSEFFVGTLMYIKSQNQSINASIERLNELIKREISKIVNNPTERDSDIYLTRKQVAPIQRTRGEHVENQDR